MFVSMSGFHWLLTGIFCLFIIPYFLLKLIRLTDYLIPGFETDKRENKKIARI